jgi:chemotaxis protein CheD
VTRSIMALRSKDNLPPILPGFAHINRYWDPHEDCFAAKILPGQYYVTLHGEMIITVLGSCVSACIRDSVFGIGGMNHFMLPDDGKSSAAKGPGRIMDESARYGVYAMELLINDILKNGGRRENLEVKITGGGRMLANMSDIGKRNIDFVRKFLVTEGLEIVAEEVGDIYPRKVQYHPGTGKVRVKKLRSMHDDTIARREHAYLRGLQQQSVQGEVELF